MSIKQIYKTKIYKKMLKSYNVKEFCKNYVAKVSDLIGSTLQVTIIDESKTERTIAATISHVTSTKYEKNEDDLYNLIYIFVEIPMGLNFMSVDSEGEGTQNFNSMTIECHYAEEKFDVFLDGHSTETHFEFLGWLLFDIPIFSNKKRVTRETFAVESIKVSE